MSALLHIQNFKRRFSGLGASIRFLLIVGIVVAGAIALFWLFNQIFYYFLAKSYVDELSRAFNINKGFTKALLWASFAALVLFAGWTFSLSKRRRTFGLIGALALLIGHGVLMGLRDANFGPDGKTDKCYVVSPEGIKILNHVGTDPESGRECRLLTPQMAEKFKAYKDGHRPQLVKDIDPAFFDPVSGEPVIWYVRTNGRIQLFDLMGFDPKTSVELKPVDRQIVEEWRKQSTAIARRAPKRVDPAQLGFFDEVTGEAKVWFWVSDIGEYEFYDGPGFQPRSGDALKVITREDITKWRQLTEAKAEQKQKEEAQKAQELQDRLARETAAKEAADRQAAEDLQKQQQAGLDCDRLAANPTDVRRKAEGVTFDALRGQADQAIDACTKATQQFPSELRYQYQLGRAYQYRDRKKAFDLLTSVVNAQYPAAFDNLGGMYLGHDDNRALQLFLRGRDLNDADSMVSLADMIDKGTYMPSDPIMTKLSLLKRAAELGHAGAQRGFPIELQKVQQLQQQQRMQGQMLDIFGHVLGAATRR